MLTVPSVPPDCHRVVFFVQKLSLVASRLISPLVSSPRPQKETKIALSKVAMNQNLLKLSTGNPDLHFKVILIMCQYYRWQCNHCPADNDVVVRCKNNHQSQRRDPCARKTTLPLPPDAPKLECQHCFTYRSIPGTPAARLNLDNSFRRLSIQQPTPSPERADHQQHPLGIQYPSDYDIFWLNPALRLPDAAGKIGEYNENRSKVMAMADEGRNVESSSGGGDEQEKKSWRNSWSQLQEALDKV